MSDGKTAGANAPAQKPGKTKVERERRKKTKREGTQSGAPRAVQSGKIIAASRDSNEPAEMFNYVFGPQHKATHDYLKCIFNPSKFQARVPASRGSFELLTKLWDTKESGTAVAGADGNAFIAVAAPNWVESGNSDGTPALDSQCVGYTTMGSACLRSKNPASNYATVPLNGSACVDSEFAWTVMDRPTDGALNNASRLRLVAMELRIHSVMAASTSKGEIMLSGTVAPVSEAQGGTLNGVSWDDVVKTNAGTVTRAIRTLPSWKSGEVFSIVAIPGEEQAFEMVQVPATARTAQFVDTGAWYTYAPWFHLLCQARSMTPGDTLNYEVTYVWESELAKTNESSTSAAKVIPVPAATLNLATANARPYSLSKYPGVHSLPWIETLAQTEPMAVAALSRHPALHPKLRPAAAPPGLVYTEPKEAEPSFLGKLGGLAKDVLDGAADSSWLKKVPYVGGALSSVAGVLGSLFG